MDIEYLLILQKLRELSGGVLDSLMMRTTALGEQIITFLALSFIYWCVDKRAGRLMAFNVSVACTWNQYTKWKCRVERPWVRDARIVPVSAALSGAGGYSFPSGHTSRAAAVWGSLSAFLWTNASQKEKKAVPSDSGKLSVRRLLSLVCGLIVLAVAFSRNYLGVHTPQDVLAALLVGAVLIFLLEKVLRWADEGANRDLLVAVAGCALCFLPMLRAGCLSNAGAGMGFFLGWVIERRFVRFDTNISWTQRGVRFIMGGTGVVFLLTVLSPALRLVMAGKYAGFFTSFALAVFIMAVYPFFFCKRERYRAGFAVAAVFLAGILGFSAWQVHMRSEAAGEPEAGQNAVAEQVPQQEPEQAQSTAQQEQTLAQSTVQAQGTTQQEPAPAQNGAVQEPWLPMVVAHSGYSSVFPENTLAAFAGALDIGVDYIELDVQMTKDGQLVVFHDDDLKRITGAEGAIRDYTLAELGALDAGSWFSSSFAGERIPTLEEALALIEQGQCGVYLELKDIGETPGFEESVLAAAGQCGMTDRCVFASFRYDNLERLKELNPEILTLYNTTSGKVTLPKEFPADYYGLWRESVTGELVAAVHEAGGKAFVWTVDTPAQIRNVQAMGADAVVTNRPGLAKVIRHPQYQYLADNFECAILMPGLYGPEIPEQCADMIVQGLTKAGNRLAVSAYSKSGESNSILYVTDLSGKLWKIVDLGFKAHTGGIAYDEEHGLLWVTGPEGKVYAVSWQDILSDAYQGEILVSFDGGLVNHNGSKVASFLALSEGELFVGSYVNGAEGALNRYDLSDVHNPRLVSTVAIPERIQGITFKREAAEGRRYMLLSQGYQTEDSHLLRFLYEEGIARYAEPQETHTLPEGAEQIQMTADGMYILFESAVRPYRATARIPNDQIWLVRE